jgi:UDP-N-acetylmuramoyl-L-alanyl-D-glutamate--2,6-diaminopimelate ligase
MGNIGVTADPQKVRPGMIYVDLSGKRNRRQIYQAYMNGAYLIFTPYNISDPDLPVVKVKNPQDTLYMMFDKFYGTREHQAKLVAVFGDSDKSELLELVQRILHEKNTGNKEWIDTIPITIDANISNLFYHGNMAIDCAILTDIGYAESCSDNPAASEYISRLLDKKTIIINNDEPNGMKVIAACKDVIPITYGLNQKASVTASSIDIEETICFNYCVQRSFRSRSDKIIEPFEVPVRLNALGVHNIYNALAAITCGLYYDGDIENIKRLVENYKAPARHFQKLYDGDYTIIDNYCSSIYDYNAAFESLQILNYESLLMIISVSQNTNMYFHGEKAQLIAEWAKMLNCKEVILTSCMDGDSRIGELPLKSIRIYKKMFKENDISFRYYHLLRHAILRSMLNLNKKDLLMLIGSDEMNQAQRFLYRYLRPSNKIDNIH